MYNLGIILAILQLGILKLVCGTDYCDPQLCTSNGVVLHHIGCKHSGKFASNCENPARIPITPFLKYVILHEHNDLRNKVANGSLPGFQSAKRMLTLTWDSELEYLAELNVLQCEMAHDDCHNTVAYKYSGQNIGIQHQTNPLYPMEYESLIIYLINEWFNEYKFATQSDIEKCLRIQRANEIGHFTAMIQERTSKVGCGISRYVKLLHGENWDTILFTCNYNYCNMVDLPIYINGPMTSACKTGHNPEFIGLCSHSEKVRPIPESEEETPLHPIFTIPNHLMQSVPSPDRTVPSIAHSGPAPSQASHNTIPAARVNQPVPSVRTGHSDYCDPNLCTINDHIAPHIGCNNNGKFASNCIRPSEIPITSHLRHVILHMHNDLRNKVANGSLPGFQTAQRMATLTWDSELEFLAGLNVHQCEMIHDACHNTIAYKYSGQNLAIQHRTDPILPAEYESIILFLIKEWFNEYRYANQNDTDMCFKRTHGNEIGHFTALIQEKTSKVGCSIAKYITFMHDKNWNTMLMACDYSFGNLIGMPIYTTGAIASACQTGSNPEFNGLCSVSEHIKLMPEVEEGQIRAKHHDPSLRPILSTHSNQSSPSAHITNYCDPALCTINGHVRPHIGCRHNGKFSRKCLDPSEISVTPHLRQIILHEHNDLRNKIANGSLPGFHSAKHMATLSWDSELEFLAGLNVRQCVMAHDQCHNTVAHAFSGQNLAIQFQTDPFRPEQCEFIIIFLIQEWFNEYRHAKQRDTDICTKHDDGHKIGHFTALVQEKSSKVGCGIARFLTFMNDGNWETILMACNYNSGNLIGLPIYTKGTTASGCRAGTNPQFNGLCSIFEHLLESWEEIPFQPQVQESVSSTLHVPWYRRLTFCNKNPASSDDSIS